MAARHARIVDGRRASGELLRRPGAGRVQARPPIVVVNLSPRIRLDLRSALTRITARDGRAGPAVPALRGTRAQRARSAPPMVARAETRVLAAAPSAPAREPAAHRAVLGGAQQILPARPEPAPPGRTSAVERSPSTPATVRAPAPVDRHAAPAASSPHVAAGGRAVRRRLRRAEHQAARSRPAMVLPPAPVSAAAAAHPAHQPPAPEPQLRLAAHGPRDPAARDAIAGVDLERLADHVVRQIDRRITAHRERFGRI
jgi:hypothetical protein